MRIENISRDILKLADMVGEISIGKRPINEAEGVVNALYICYREAKLSRSKKAQKLVDLSFHWLNVATNKNLYSQYPNIASSIGRVRAEANYLAFN